jgi:hypothetical protein
MFKNAPSLYTLEELVEHGTNPETETEHPSGEWIPARYMGMYGLRNRLRLAVLVFTGKADAVIWPGGQ